jgi:hypothetical protein
MKADPNPHFYVTAAEGCHTIISLTFVHGHVAFPKMLGRFTDTLVKGLSIDPLDILV